MTTTPSERKGTARWLLVASAAFLAIGTACVGSGGDTYEEFTSALRANASCAELFDQRANFDDEQTLEKIEADLEEIGCDSRSSERNDA